MANQAGTPTAGKDAPQTKKRAQKAKPKGNQQAKPEPEAVVEQHPDATAAPEPNTEPELESDFGLVIALAIIDTVNRGDYRTVSAAVQKAALLAIYAFEGEIVTPQCVAGYVGCSADHAGSALATLYEAGYSDRADEKAGQAFRYSLNRENIKAACSIFEDVNQQTDTVSLASRESARATYDRIVGAA